RSGSRDAGQADGGNRVVVHVRSGAGYDAVEQDADELRTGSRAGQGVDAGLRVGSETNDIAGNGEGLSSAGGRRGADVDRVVQRPGGPGASCGLIKPVIGD